MGKGDDELELGVVGSAAPADEGQNAGPRCSQCRSIGKIVRLRCVGVLALGLALLLSAVFWLPPFFGKGGGARGHDQDHRIGADIVASFRLERHIPFLNANIAQLQYDIFEEIGVVNSSVVIVSLDPLPGLNSTNVEFAIWPYPRSSAIPSTGLSLLRSSFMSLVIKQLNLHLSPTLFGSSYFFQVLKFPGGITIIPPQSVFLLQTPQAFFNFTLNFPIDEVQDKISELKEQMKLGLLLNPHENLYVSLTNLNGSTIAPPIIVQTSIVLAVGNVQPSLPRLKQLAKTITSSSQGNLGLNHTVFGRVKQIQLSSYLQHSLGSGGDSSTYLSPSPAPQPHLPHHHHHHHHHHHQQHHHHHHHHQQHHHNHHHHHHHHHSDVYLAPAPAPAPQYFYQAPVPSGHCVMSSSKHKDMIPVSAPVASSRQPSAPPLYKDVHVPAAPHLSSASPLPIVAFAHARPLSSSVTDLKPPYSEPSVSPSPFSFSIASQPSVFWVLAPVMHLLMLL